MKTTESLTVLLKCTRINFTTNENSYVRISEIFE